MNKEPSDRIKLLLKKVIDEFDGEDQSIRETQILKWKHLKLLWESYSRVWYSSTAHDWRIWDENSSESFDADQAYYDKPINVFRAYLESIIAALSVTVPPIKCYPDNADDTLDLATAKAGDKIAALIYRHNDAPLFWLHALFVYCTEGMVGCYSYSKKDKKYGTYEVEKYRNDTEEHELVICPECGFNIDDTELTPEVIALREQVKLNEDKFQPGPEDVLLQDEIQNNPELEECPNCLQLVAPHVSRETLVIERLVGVTNEPKSRICMEAYGGLNIKIPNYARKQEDCPYLRFAYETNYVNAMEQFSHLQGKDNKEKLYKKIKANSGGYHDPYEQWGRLSPQYNGENPDNVVTMNNWWLRPCAFNVLPEEADIKELKRLYPNGVHVTLVNDEFGSAENENLDDSWTLTYNPLADFVHHDPLGLLLVSIQDITNDLISLVLQTIEHGIPQTFADPAVLNFNAYRNMASTPGAIYEATPKSGKAVSDAFYEVKTATLSQEVMPFAQYVQSLGQIASGSLPSIFGGQIEGSETASEYSMSRAQALQRLQGTWKILCVWWKTIFGKVIPLYIKETKDDERDVQKNKDGTFLNILIRKAELEGKIGKVELEANENLPLTWNQQKDVIMQLLQNANPQILSILAAPENLPYIRQAIGLTDMHVPGEDDVIKAQDDIKTLLNSEPQPNPAAMDPMMMEQAAMTGQPIEPEISSIQFDPIFDNPAIIFEIVRKWVISEEGRQAKIDNEAGYRNVLLYGTSVKQFMDMQMAQQQMALAGQTPPEKSTELDRETPIQGEENVGTIQ